MPNAFNLTKFFAVPDAIKQLPLDAIIHFINETSHAWADVSEREQKSKPRSRWDHSIIEMDDQFNRLRFFFSKDSLHPELIPKITEAEVPVFQSVIQTLKEKGLPATEYNRHMARLSNSPRS
jgi:hypothetical protein